MISFTEDDKILILIRNIDALNFILNLYNTKVWYNPDKFNIVGNVLSFSFSSNGHFLSFLLTDEKVLIFDWLS
jgi:hypothetical protein